MRAEKFTLDASRTNVALSSSVLSPCQRRTIRCDQRVCKCVCVCGDDDYLSHSCFGLCSKWQSDEQNARTWNAFCSNLLNFFLRRFLAGLIEHCEHINRWSSIGEMSAAILRNARENERERMETYLHYLTIFTTIIMCIQQTALFV